MLPQQWHRRPAFDAGAAQQLQQQSFGLVVQMLCEHDEISLLPRIDRVARAARGGLHAFGAIRRDIHRAHVQRDTQAFALARAKRGPAARVGTDAVIDVYAGQPESQRLREPAQHLEQHHRVEAAGKAQYQPGPGEQQRFERCAYCGFEVVNAIWLRLP